MADFWTSQLVNEHLIQAFRTFPHHCVFTVPGGIRAFETQPFGAHPATVDAFSWAPRFLGTYPRARLHLFAWARCRAQRVSWAALCDEMKWPLSSANVSRVLGSTLIAEALNREALDTTAQDGNKPRTTAVEKCLTAG